jgi:hypothetical protein
VAGQSGYAFNQAFQRSNACFVEVAMPDQIRSGQYVSFVGQGGISVTVVRYGGVFVRVTSDGGTPVTYVKYGGTPISVDNEMDLPEEVREELGY